MQLKGAFASSFLAQYKLSALNLPLADDWVHLHVSQP